MHSFSLNVSFYLYLYLPHTLPHTQTVGCYLPMRENEIRAIWWHTSVAYSSSSALSGPLSFLSLSIFSLSHSFSLTQSSSEDDFLTISLFRLFRARTHTHTHTHIQEHRQFGDICQLCQNLLPRNLSDVWTFPVYLVCGLDHVLIGDDCVRSLSGRHRGMCVCMWEREGESELTSHSLSHRRSGFLLIRTKKEWESLSSTPIPLLLQKMMWGEAMNRVKEVQRDRRRGGLLFNLHHTYLTLALASAPSPTHSLSPSLTFIQTHFRMHFLSFCTFLIDHTLFLFFLFSNVDVWQRLFLF